MPFSELENSQQNPISTWIMAVRHLEELSQHSVDDVEKAVEDYPLFAKYHVISRIGGGGMGKVFAAWDLESNQAVALKIFAPRNEDSWNLIKRFQNEVELLESLSHPNIVKLLGKGNVKGRIYFAMNLVAGVPLSDLASDWSNQAPQPAQTVAGRTSTSADSQDEFELASPSGAFNDSNLDDVLPTEFQNVTPFSRQHFRLVAKIGQQVCDGLHNGHSQGILHRDIKPSNLILDQCGMTWIADFGLAKLDLHNGIGSESPTRQGDLIGTIAYMSSGVIRQKFSSSSDLYSLGATLYELASLKALWGERTETEILHSLVEGARPTPIRQVCPEIPEDLETLIDGLLGIELVSSPVSAEQFRDSFAAFSTGRPVVAPSGTSNIRFRANNALRHWTRPNEHVFAFSIWCLLLTGFVMFSGYRSMTEAKATKVAAANLHDDVEDSILQAINSVGLLASFVETTEEMDKEIFSTFGNSMLSNQPGIFSIGLAQTVNDPNREAFEKHLSKIHGSEGLQILSIGPDGNLATAESVSQYVVVQHVEPYAKHKGVLGLNLVGDPQRKAAITTANETKETAVAGPVVFYDKEIQRPGFVVVHPIFRDNQPPSYTIVVFRFDDLLKRLESPSQNYQLDVRVIATDDFEGEQSESESSKSVIYEGNQNGDSYRLRNPNMMHLDFSLDVANAGWRMECFRASTHSGSWLGWIVKFLTVAAVTPILIVAALVALRRRN